MIMNCATCNKRIEETFLRKIIGTYIKDKKGKKRPVCQTCQKNLTITQLKEKI